jgi:hypothetical protein
MQRQMFPTTTSHVSRAQPSRLLSEQDTIEALIKQKHDGSG